MFPSANYFRDIPCPFFSRVACPRPHCHFKHVQASLQSNTNTNKITTTTTTSTTTSTTTPSSINIPPDANETLNKLINQLSTAAAAANSSSTLATNPIPSVDFTSILQNTLLQSLTTAFTNAINSTTQSTNNNSVSEKITQAVSTVATQLHQTSSSSTATATPPPPPTTTTTTTNPPETVPEYRPTPIAELERRKRIQQQQTVKSDIKTDFDSDEYVQATFSPPAHSPPPTSLVQSESLEQSKLKVSTISKTTQPTSSNVNPKPSLQSNVDDQHSWVAPPVRQKSSISDDHNDFDERISSPSIEKTLPSTKVLNKPTATVKPNVIENPLLKRIPKKTTTTTTTTATTTKVRIADIDLDNVPLTRSISMDIEKNSNKKKIPTTLKRSSNGGDIIPQKKSKLNSTTVSQTVNKKPNVSNGNNPSMINNNDDDDNDDDNDRELALFDQAFSSSKSIEPKIPSKPPTLIQQFTSRYSLIKATSTDSNSPSRTRAETSTDSNSTNRTRAETSTDGRRIAHQPKIHSNPTNSSSTAVFQPLVDSNSSVNKIPFKTRQEYLTFFLNELKKHSTTNSNNSTPTTPILSRAQSIEKEIFDKSTNRNSYLNLAAKYLRQIRAEDPNTKNSTEKNSSKITNRPKIIVSHSEMLTGGNKNNISIGIKKQKDVNIKTLKDDELYTLLLAYKASEQDLVENGYPAFSLDFPDKVLIKNKNPLYNSTIKIYSSDRSSRTCCRCGATYKIDKDGEYLKEEICIYHWGRIRTQRVVGQIEKNYSCCSSKTNSTGCSISQYHVHESDDSQLLSGFVKTQPLRRSLNKDESYGIFALDCEMVYTVNGLELVRVSVINHKMQSVYETLVKPFRKILDYNTRWSGITEQHLQDCNVTLPDVQKHLLNLFNDKTILVGHSLESDLKALKIVHETVVDTSLVFPHVKGKPFKRALRTLMAEFLSKMIQENANGHDSMEDATSCMELILWKVKVDLKTG